MYVLTYERQTGSLMKRDRLLGAPARPEPPAHQVLDRLLGRRTSRVQHQRGIPRDAAERDDGLLHGTRDVGVVRDAGPGDVLRRDLLLLVAEQDLGGQAGDPLRDERRRRADHLRRLLELAGVPHAKLLLPGVLGVVARVRLVRSQLDDERRRQRSLGVDLDSAPQAAEVVVVGGPGLVRDVVHLDVLRLGKPDEGLRAGAEVLE